MEITVISGTEKKGVTHRLKELFLEECGKDAVIHEFYLPRDCPDFCSGCTGCFLNGEDCCRDAAYTAAIGEALYRSDLIVMTSPVYAFHATAAMKNLLDHFAYRWMVHRPHPAMFSKRAVILTQSIGAGGKSAAKDIKDSLSWWGISEIHVCSMRLMEDVFWEKLSPERRRILTEKVQRLGRKLARRQDRPARTGLAARAKFMICRMMQQSVYRSAAAGRDALYWKEQGWLDGRRPWKTK